MKRGTFSLWQIPVWVPMVAAWCFVVLLAEKVGPFLVLLILLGITCAVHHLICSRRNSWLISATLAPLIAVSSLLVVAAWSWYSDYYL